MTGSSRSAELRIETLAKRHERSAFSCSSEALDRYLRLQARQDADKHVAAAFVLVEPPSPQVLGYYTLSGSVVQVTELAEELARKQPRYPELPVTLLGRLAVDQSCKGRGLGEFLLIDALSRSLGAAAQIASMAVVVDAKGNVAETFYAHFGFARLQQRPARLFLPMQAVAKLLG